MTLTLALAGDTMLGRGVGEALLRDPRRALVHPAIVEAARSADLFLVNLECCMADRGRPIALPGKPFFFRAPPVAAERLAQMGVHGVTLANNHVLDFGPDALADTLAHLASAGVVAVGAGDDTTAARAAHTFTTTAGRLRVVAASDHPAAYAAGAGRPGIAFADLRHEVPQWLLAAAAPDPGDLVLVTVHWGPNMAAAPVRHVHAAARALQAAGATLVAGHSAHVPQGVRGHVLFDLGDFVDDYRRDEVLRNDLSLLWLVTLDAGGPVAVQGVPVRLEYAHTRPADAAEARELARLMADRCSAVGSTVELTGGRLRFHRRPRGSTDAAASCVLV